MIEPRIKGYLLVVEGQPPVASERLRQVFEGKIIAAGGFEPNTAEAVVEKGDADLVAFGRYFISNPDLPKRIKLKLPLNSYDRSTFCTFDARGYKDPAMSNVNTFSNPREPVARIVGASGILRNNFDVFEPGDLVAAAKLQYVPLSLDAICPISTEVA